MKYMINRAFGLRGVLTLLALMLAFAASAQNKITGKVVDENDQPAIGANVVVKGTTQGVSTDLKGMFAIPVKTGDVLVFSYLGYKSQEVKIAAQTRLDIKLVPEANIMDEVVVVGYGAVKRGDLTGSVASVSSKDVEGFKTGSVMEALGGQIAGVQITATDGTPGAGFDIKVRGVGSVNGDTSPLYIVDGFQVDNIDYLSNSDIESIEVLKDASSSAIYGSRAANGVVMVTTKSGKVGRPVVTYNGSASYRQISGTLDLLSPYETADRGVARQVRFDLLQGRERRQRHSLPVSVDRGLSQREGRRLAERNVPSHLVAGPQRLGFGRQRQDQLHSRCLLPG